MQTSQLNRIKFTRNRVKYQYPVFMYEVYCEDELIGYEVSLNTVKDSYAIPEDIHGTKEQALIKFNALVSVIAMRNRGFEMN
jgi:hypothetical protein